MNARGDLTGVAVALALGAALRIFHLGVESVWFDEAYSIALAQRSVGGILLERWTDIHPPLYYLGLHFWMPFAGASEAGARLLSVISDLLMIPAAWLAARRLFGSKVALVTAFLLACSPFHVQYAQEARMYALLCLLATISMRAFLTFFEGAPLAWRVIYAASTSLMLYTHIYSVFVVAAQVTTVGIVWWRDRQAFRRVIRPWVLTAGAVGLLYIPWIVSLVDQVSRVQGAFWISHPLWIAMFHPLLAYSGSVPLALVLVPLGLVGVSELWTRTTIDGFDGGPSPAALVVPWFLMSTALPFLLSEIGSPIFLPKYTIVASVPFAMFVALGLMRVPRLPWRALVGVAVIALSVLRFYTYFTVPKKDGWRRAAATLESLAHPGDVVYFYPWFNQIPFDYYHRRQDLERLPLVPDLHTPLPGADAIPSLVQAAADTRTRVWLVVQQGITRRSLIISELDRTMTPVQHLAAEHVELFLFEK